MLAAGRSRRSGRIHKSCRRVPGGRRTWLEEQVLRLRRAGFAPVRIIAGQRSRRLWRCCRLRVRRRINWQAARLGPFSSVQLGMTTTSSSILMVQSDTQLPPNAQLRRLRLALSASAAMAVRLVDQRGHGGHPVLIGKTLAQHIRAVSDAGRLDHVLQSLPANALATLSVRRFRSYPRLNRVKEWKMAMAQLRVWARRP
ncbi:NTP transferase domain-containing protein [Acidithiobacillus ferrooxidans]|uniref:NTP transferase domain-containing protein n=1 Tax=Acidithiobacillus ferrooxidans TaxID=920 RepID=UPI0027E0F71C|nr:NTP transferase domain-containing protein [Acidithiobacillus ferrooxidans]